MEGQAAGSIDNGSISIPATTSGQLAKTNSILPNTESEHRRTGSASTSSASSRRSSSIRRTGSKRKTSLTTAPLTLRAQASSNGAEERSFTSFPSLSPENSPHAVRRGAKHLASQGVTKHDGGVGNGGTSKSISADQMAADATVDTSRQPKMNLVETLMSGGGPSRARDALFADSPATTAQDVPGALHHASDDHVRRLVAKKGVVSVVRQLAQDLAQREAEMTTLRLRAEARERELKRMLREVEVSNLDIERRLHRLDEPEEVTEGGEDKRRSRISIGSVGELVGEALSDDLAPRDEEVYLTEGVSSDRQATIRAAAAKGVESTSLSSSVDSGKKQGWVNYFLGGSSNTVRRHRGSSPSGHDAAHTAAKTAVLPGRRKGIDESLFQPMGSDAEAGSTNMSRSDSNMSDKAGRRASRSSWTLKLFAGATSNQKDGDTSATGRGRSTTVGSDASRSLRDVSQSSKHTVDSNATRSRQAQRRSTHAISISVPSKSDAKSISSLPVGSPPPPSVSENLGPVEMDAILPHGSRPPTLTPTHEGIEGQSDVLTDRFGFIYDQRRRKREAEAMARGNGNANGQPKEMLSASSDLTEADDNPFVSSSTTPTSMGDIDEDDEVAADTASGPSRKWQDYLKIAALPTELLSQTPAPMSPPALPSAKVTGKKALKRMPTYGDNTGDAVSPNPAPSPSNITAGKGEIAKPVLSGPNSPAASSNVQNDHEPVKILLAQLSELHDKLQREKTVRWNDFMRKVRAERRREGEYATESRSANKSVQDLPEANIADGEIIGIASLGHKGKVGRAKYHQFKALVLGGIPIVHRAKVWSECSGANALRIPGYYQELVQKQDDADPVVLQQIDLDINRTLTDNVFFRRGPGVAKLKEVLIAYSQHNVEVNYCQGLNMIVASLLLIMPTNEDVFWILASLVETILPQHYYDNSLLASRADQQVLRSYVAELLPKLSAHLEELGVELEAFTFTWFLSLFTDCLSAEALYRVWDVLLCLASDDGNGGSTFLFQVALALLKLNEAQLTACDTPAEVYAYLGGEITNHAISIDGLIRASEGLKTLVKRKQVEERRKKWVKIEEDTIRERELIRNGDVLARRKSVEAQA